ncbi:MAG: hypothetical protein K8H85_13260 [Cyclobacteriaceae bacterium]|nr:hypothetical protein [Cyclobacteriaceae bacterium]
MVIRFNLLILSFSLLLNACQSEIDQLILPTEQTLTSSSPVTGLLKKMTLKDGSIDNILDKASCLTIQLPVTVVVNNQQINIDIEEDIKFIGRIFDEFENDLDTLYFIFPITVITTTYQSIQVTNSDELLNLAAMCSEEGEDDDDIECLDFDFPFTISIYNSVTQSQNVKTINTDEELWMLLDDLDDNDLLSFQFPITLIVFDGTTLTITDNNQLEEAITAYKTSCDEDDDFDFHDDRIDKTELFQVLTSHEWKI